MEGEEIHAHRELAETIDPALTPPSPLNLRGELLNLESGLSQPPLIAMPTLREKQPQKTTNLPSPLVPACRQTGERIRVRGT